VQTFPAYEIEGAAVDDLEILKWRESKLLAIEDHALADEFATRATEVRSQVCFLLSGGLTEGAEEALAALAEEDMVDFCIMVDLAGGVAIGGLDPLDAQTRLHLTEFLDEEPWRSLSVDNDIIVALAMIEEILAEAEVPWYRASPQLPVTLANLMDRVDREQYVRFAAEFEARLKRHPDHAWDAVVLVREIVRAGARRLGVHAS
jgi:hypothetical protein